MNKAQQRYFNTQKGKDAIKRYQQSEKGRLAYNKARAKNHRKHRKKDNAKMRERYQENKEYHKIKNKQHYQENGEKWKKRRAELTEEWHMNRCAPAVVQGTFESLGASITVTEPITFTQLNALITALGYDPQDANYPPFMRRVKYFNNKKRTP